MNDSERILPLPETEAAGLKPHAASVLGLKPVRVIAPGRGTLRNLARDLWHYRELLYFFTWRDVKVRYKQTVLGVVWAILQPVVSMVVLTMFFGHLAGIARQTGGTPYPIFVYAGLLPWTFFANTLSTSSGSVVSNVSLVTKVRFPRIMLPMAGITAGLVDLVIAFVVLLGIMLAYHVPITGRLLWTPLLVVGIALMTLGFGSIFATLTVAYRDFKFIIPFMTQLWMFMTPVIYPTSVVPEKWRWLLALNPLVGWIDAFRSVFLGYAMNWTHLGLSVLATLLTLLAGIAYFNSAERRFTDII
jgi:lipopolysaccharide transport system permease protein